LQNFAGFSAFQNDQFRDLFEKMVAYDPNERPSLDEVIIHPWLQGETYSLEQI